MSASRVLGAVWCFCLAAALAGAGEMPAGSLRLSRIAIVDADKAHFTRDLEARFTERLDAALSEAFGAGETARLERISPREAAARMKRGACDAILFVGTERPGALRALDASTFAALCGHVLAPTPVYLIVPNSDPGRKRVFGEAFAAAVGDIPNRERVAALE